MSEAIKRLRSKCIDGNLSQSSSTRTSAAGSHSGRVSVEMRRTRPATPILSSLSASYSSRARGSPLSFQNRVLNLLDLGVGQQSIERAADKPRAEFLVGFAGLLLIQLGDIVADAHQISQHRIDLRFCPPARERSPSPVEYVPRGAASRNATRRHALSPAP